jgi:hypothetical protein
VLCTWSPSNYLTRLTGMRRLLARVGSRDAATAFTTTNIVVWVADPAQAAQGHGQLPGLAGGSARLVFSARYESPDATRPSGHVRFDDDSIGLHFQTNQFDWFVVSQVRASRPPDRIALAGTGRSAGRPCSFLLFAHGPTPPEFAAGERRGEVRARIACGDDIIDTNPSDDLDVDSSPLTPFTAGFVRLEYPWSLP